MFLLTLVLGIVTFLLIALHWYQTQSRFAKLLNEFPMLPYKPLIGHVIEFSTNAEVLFRQVRKLTTSFKETSGLWSVFFGAIHIVTAEDAEIVLSNINYIRKGMAYSFVKPWLGDGLLISDGVKWQQRRKILTPTFHFNILRRFVEIFGEHSIELVNKLKKESEKSESNLVHIVTHETLASICETAMGTKLDMKDKKHTGYLNAIYDIASSIIHRVLIPPYYSDFIFNLSPMGFYQRRLLKTLHNFTSDIIKERENNFKESDVTNLDNNKDENDGIKKKRLAMLDLLISAKRNQGVIDTLGIREEVDTFMFEGHDTTAIAICMNLMLLAHHKDIQDKIIEELDAIFGEDVRPASYEDLMNMKYLELCIKESLRLYPSVPLITRKLREEVPLTRHTIPIGCEIFIHIYDIHRDPNIYSDPEKYDPNRFLTENSKGRHPYAYIPFSAGPRNCIGQKYAMLEMKSIISAVFRNFTLEPVSKFEELRWAIDLVLRVNGPINVKFISRK